MTAPSTSRTEIAYLADQIERSFRGGAWHGPAVAEVLDGVDAAAAAERPLAHGHSIRELVHHIRTWIDITRRRLEGAEIDLPDGCDWPAPGGGALEWAEELAALEEAHRQLKATLRNLRDDRLADPVADCDPTVRGLLFGLLQHNAYHAGQLLLLKRALPATPATPSIPATTADPGAR